jgi:hypothetical protein
MAIAVGVQRAGGFLLAALEPVGSGSPAHQDRCLRWEGIP